MKSFAYVSAFLVMMVQWPGVSASQPDSLFALVDSNVVTLWDLHALRNCAAEYRMEITQNGQQLTWIQRDTAGYAYCYCEFDYNIQFGPLQPGDYTTEVFFTESGETVLIPLGSITFSILNPLTDTSVVFQPFSSKCGGLYLGVQESQKQGGPRLGQNYPNPLSEYTFIPVLTPDDQPLKILIYNSIGKKVREIPTSGHHSTGIPFNRRDDSGNRLPAGIYYYGADSDAQDRFHRLVIL